jgi:phosphoribosylformylglycinamidine synthase
MPDITKVVTPDIKKHGSSRLIFIDLAKGKRRLGGSALAQCYGKIGNECPDVEDPELLKRAFNAIQKMIDKDLILAGHDVSDGGLIVTLLEMAFAGNCGFSLLVNERFEATWFAEEVGLVIECDWELDEVVKILREHKIPSEYLGYTLTEPRIFIAGWGKGNPVAVLEEDMRELRQIWEETSYQLECLQCDPECAEEEKRSIYDRKGPQYHLSFIPEPTPEKLMNATDKPKVAIIREEGSNGDREMTSAFYQAGFDCYDVTMTDLLEDRITLDQFHGIAFVGGFSYADVLDSAKGWAGVIRFNSKIWEQFERFYYRSDTFSLGVCNGCQLMALLGWVPWRGIPDADQPRFIHNLSGRFESRFSTVKIFPSPAIMLAGMEGSTLGIWVAHGEGRLFVPKTEMLEEITHKSLAPVRYVNDYGGITEWYPFNPNGSLEGITGLCSPDGRHLAMMPHPERTFLKWQWPWMPEEFKKFKASPWLKMFQNAREWCG